MKFLGLDRVLCLSPHPDDVEYAMGGTVLKNHDTEFTVYTMSSGSKGDRYDGADRRREVERFWSNVRSDVKCEFSAAEFIGDLGEEDWIHATERFPGHDGICAPPWQDSHYEHALTNRVGRALCRNTPISFIEYCAPSTDLSWTANILVDVGEQFDKKRGALLGFVSQEKRPYFRGAVLDTYHRNMQAGKKGVLYVERFRAVEVYR